MCLDLASYVDVYMHHVLLHQVLAQVQHTASPKHLHRRKLLDCFVCVDGKYSAFFEGGRQQPVKLHPVDIQGTNVAEVSISLYMAYYGGRSLFNLFISFARLIQ